MTAALLLLASWAGAIEAGVQPPSRPCAINTRPPRYEADSSECRFLETLEEAFHKLRAAADLSPQEVSFSKVVSLGNAPNAHYRPRPGRQIHVNQWFVACEHERPDFGIIAVAHEVAHALQDKFNMIETAFQKAALDPDPPSANYYLRALESHADRIGDDLLRKAGFDLSRSDEFSYARRCAGWTRTGLRSHGTHPPDIVRWAESVYERQLSRAGASKVSATLPESVLAQAVGLTPLTETETAQGAARTVYARGYELKPGQYAPFDVEFDHQGRRLLSPDERRLVEQGIPERYRSWPKDGAVELPDGRRWTISPLYFHVSPAEIVAFTMADDERPPSMDLAFWSGLWKLRHSGAWALLPGEVTGP